MQTANVPKRNHSPTALKHAGAILVMALQAGAAHGFDAQGHRGARGLMPENTLPGFAAALDWGMNTLELDVGVSKDGVLVVSHDAHLNAAFTRDRLGRWLTPPTAAIRALRYDELNDYDVGRANPAHRYSRRFPKQQTIDGTRIPRLADVFELVIEKGADTTRFNVETKIRPTAAPETASPQVFVDALLATAKTHRMAARLTIQSFDWRTLRLVQQSAPGIATAYLTAQQDWLDNLQQGRPGPSPWTAGLDIDDFGGDVPALVKAAGGNIWSPYHRDLSAASLARAHELGVKVIVWTVNTPARMHELMAMGVDGLITDYPNRLRAVMRERGL